MSFGKRYALVLFYGFFANFKQLFPPPPSYADLNEQEKARIGGGGNGDADSSPGHRRVIKKLVARIDEELWSSQSHVMKQYNAKSRSLRFNLKDAANTLARQVMLKEVSVSRLVVMTPDDMASSKLKEWRANAQREQLEMMMKEAEETAMQPPMVLKKTHKGVVLVKGGSGGGAGGGSGSDATLSSEVPAVAPVVAATATSEEVMAAPKAPLKNGRSLESGKS